MGLGILLLLLVGAGLAASYAGADPGASQMSASPALAAPAPSTDSAAKRRRCRRGQIGAVVRGRRFSSSRARVFGGRRLRRGQRLVCARFRKPARGEAGSFRATARLMRSGHLQRRPTRRLFKRRLARQALRMRGATDRAFLGTLGGAGVARAGPKADAGPPAPWARFGATDRRPNGSTAVRRWRPSRGRQTKRPGSRADTQRYKASSPQTG